MGSSPSQTAGTNTVELQQCDKHIQTSAIQTSKYANQAKHSKKSDTGESTITRNENSENTPLTTEQGTLKKDANGFQILSFNEENDISDNVLKTESNESNIDDEDVISSLADTVLSRIQEDINNVVLHVDFKEKVAVNKAEVRDLLSGLKEISFTYSNKDRKEFHVGISDILIETELIKAICNITINEINIKKEKRVRKGLLNALSLAWNTTNVSDRIR
ncbi:hypothetical protein DPMN_183001 [Dreissena polymorpha]|uniref:Uncharacterized protein n=1 Tax=Dreissena polymorpha TaxID=45954 RepID=A0A9D4I547_DREPO|nr:hypothetical protein DPMN_183001 [Dreissena polymorpha]